MNQTYIRHTNGHRVVLFIHGFLGSPQHFDVFVPLVPRDCAVYNLQLAGHGGSVRDFAETSMKEWKAQVDQVMRELTARYREVIIVAHSMGTLFAMSAAVHYPRSVRHLLLMQTPLKIAVSPKAVWRTARQIPQRGETTLAFQKASGVILNPRPWEYLGWIPRYLELFAEARYARQVIQKVHVPCIVFQSAHDELVSIRSVDYIPKREGFTVHILKDSGHFIYADDDFAQIRQTFLSLFERIH